MEHTTFLGMIREIIVEWKNYHNHICSVCHMKIEDIESAYISLSACEWVCLNCWNTVIMGESLCQPIQTTKE